MVPHKDRVKEGAAQKGSSICSTCGICKGRSLGSPGQTKCF